jgi:tRNA threonylcarbamoyladenosine biosynthesis protein TsaB
MKLLALDTASGQCSVALLLDGTLSMRAVPTARDHAQLLLPMIDELLAAAAVSLRQLDGIAFGRGPGSFTGVRIAAAATQGLALGADLPVMPISDLRALAQLALRRVLASGTVPGGVLACMDARMGEVYWACFEPQPSGAIAPQAQERVGSPAEVIARAIGCTVAAGKGLYAWPQITDSLHLDAAYCFSDAEPHAQDIARLAAQDLAAGVVWRDAGHAVPEYVRDQVAKPRVDPGM